MDRDFSKVEIVFKLIISKNRMCTLITVINEVVILLVN